MSENFLEEIKRMEKIERLKRAFPGDSCGNDECEKLCAETLEIAKLLSVDPRMLIEGTIARSIVPKYGCVKCESSTPSNGVCRFGYTEKQWNCRQNFADSPSDTRKIIGKKYISDSDASKSGACQECLKNANRIYKWPEEAKLMAKLPIHPNCKCHFENVYENQIKITSISQLQKLVDTLLFIWRNKIPKPPKITTHEGVWLELLCMWFFELGNNPIRFNKHSSYSRDIANSYSIQFIKRKYIENKKIPQGWQFTGPITAKNVLGEVEWFIGSYDIQNFKERDGIVTFTVHNISSWRSGTRLPKSWTDYIENKTGFKITELVTSAPRGLTLKMKIKKLLPPELLKNSFSSAIVERLLDILPSFGGNWEQFFEVEIKL